MKIGAFACREVDPAQPSSGGLNVAKQLVSQKGIRAEIAVEETLMWRLQMSLTRRCCLSCRVVTTRWLAIVGVVAALHAGSQANADPLATKMWQITEANPKATLVHLHGLGGRPDGTLITGLLHAFARGQHRLRVVAPWVRPVELRDGQVVGAGMESMSAIIKRARPTIDAELSSNRPVFLIGHSLGARAALKLQKEYGSSIHGTIGLAPALNNVHGYWKYLTTESGLPSKKKFDRKLKEHEQWLRQELGKHWTKKLQKDLDWLLFIKDNARHDEKALQSSIHSPTLVLHGTHDGAVTIHYARRLAADPTNKGVTLHELPGLDHGFWRQKQPGSKERELKNADLDLISSEIAGFIQQYGGSR